MKTLFKIFQFLASKPGVLAAFQKHGFYKPEMSISGILNDADTIFTDKICPIYNDSNRAEWATCKVFIAQQGVDNPPFFNMAKHVPHVIFYVQDIGYALHILGNYIKNE